MTDSSKLVELTLPSGLQVRVPNLQPFDVFMAGFGLWNPLYKPVSRASVLPKKKPKGMSDADWQKLRDDFEGKAPEDPEFLAKILVFVRGLVIEIFNHETGNWEHPADPILDLTEDDLGFLFNWARGKRVDHTQFLEFLHTGGKRAWTISRCYGGTVLPSQILRIQDPMVAAVVDFTLPILVAEENQP